jgi:hypothetical protein
MRIRQGELEHLDMIRRYWKGVQRLPTVIPTDAPREVRELGRIARVNICKIIVDSIAQSLFVDNFRSENDSEEIDVWGVWQANKMDARQTGLHRAAAAYGAAYTLVLPGDPLPVIRVVSPRNLTAVYGDDPDWPVYALERRGLGEWRLYDASNIYVLQSKDDIDNPAAQAAALQGQDVTPKIEFEFVSTSEHGAGVTPVIRYLDEEDLDADDDVNADPQSANMVQKPMRGQIAPVMPLQDQIDLTTFGLKVAEHFSAFRQRYIIGWVPDSEAEKMKAGASRLWTFDGDPEGPNAITVGEFNQSDLSGYIESREASIRHAATLTQTPVHELIGELVNLSAEALSAAEAGRDRKVDERKTILGEAHEQTLRLAGKLATIDVPDDAEVIWRDTSARTFAATVDGLGKLATMLGVTAQELWERIPGVTKQDVERWKNEAKTGDSFAQLQAILDKHAAPSEPTPPPAAA